MRRESEHYKEIELVLKETGQSFQVQFKKQATMDVTMDVEWLNELKGEMYRADPQAALKLKNDNHFRKAYLVPAIEAGLIEMTIPDKPRSRNQKYRLTKKGKRTIKE